jgi:hypothetical protein
VRREHALRSAPLSKQHIVPSAGQKARRFLHSGGLHLRAKIELTPAQHARAKHLYEETLVPARQIAASLGVSYTWLYNLVPKEHWRRRKANSGDFQFARFLAEAEALAPAPSDADTQLPVAIDPEAIKRGSLTLTLRMQGAAERVIDAAVRVIATVRPGDHGEGERCARIVAVVAHALREVAELTKPTSAPEAHEPDDDDDDPVPRDLDQFRLELARRIRGFIEARESGAERPAHAGELPQIAERPLE